VRLTERGDALSDGAILVVIGLVIVFVLVSKVIGPGRRLRTAEPATRADPTPVPTAHSIARTTPPMGLTPYERRAADRYREKLNAFEKELKQVRVVPLLEQRLKDLKWANATGNFIKVLGRHDSALSVQDCEEILTGLATAPRGLLVLSVDAPTLPEVPTIPADLDTAGLEFVFKNAQEKLAQIKEAIQSDVAKERAIAQTIANEAAQGAKEAIEGLVQIALRRHPIRQGLSGNVDVAYAAPTRVVLVTIDIPDLKRITITKPTGRKRFGDNKAISATEFKRVAELVLHSLCLRAAYLAAAADNGGWWDTVVVNARQEWIDPATGTARSGIVASLQAQTAELLAITLENVDVRACFRHLKGVSTPSLVDISPVRPILQLNKDDSRIVDGRDVASEISETENLAGMEWDDFEHLVRQLFEWEFGRNGVEVKVTRASRDRGVDAIMFDPDPLRGGKYVLQAKRYTRTVDVAAVRDLYGTVVNEGANRGILVTTKRL
jgi:hypothetical protein